MRPAMHTRESEKLGTETNFLRVRSHLNAIATLAQEIGLCPQFLTNSSTAKKY